MRFSEIVLCVMCLLFSIGWTLNFKLKLLLSTQHIFCVFTTVGVLVLAH